MHSSKELRSLIKRLSTLGLKVSYGPDGLVLPSEDQMPEDLAAALVRHKDDLVRFVAPSGIKKLPIARVADRDRYPVTTQQARLYAIQQNDRTGVAYNMPMAYRVRGEFSVERFTGAVCELVSAWTNLRTTFDVASGALWQRVRSDLTPSVQVEDCFGWPESDLRQSFIRPFDLNNE